MTTRKTKNTLKKLKLLAGKELTFGNLLWAIRKGEEKTQMAFAQELNVSTQYLSDLENGRRLVSPKTAADYAEKLGYGTDQFIRLCFQDMLNRDGLAFHVEIRAVG